MGWVGGEWLERREAEAEKLAVVGGRADVATERERDETEGRLEGKGDEAYWRRESNEL